MKEKHDIDEADYVEAIEPYLKSTNPSTIYLFQGSDSDSDL